MARILLATFGSLGDLHPYIAVGRALLAQGHAARIATSAGYQPRVLAAGLEFAPVPPSLEQLGDPGSLGQRLFDPVRGTSYLVRHIVMPHLRAAHAALEEAAADCDLLLSHPLTFMVPVTAIRQRKPWLSSVLAPSSLLSRSDPPVITPINSLQIARRLGPWVQELLLRFIRRTIRRWEAPLHAYREELGLPATSATLLFEFSPRGTLALFDAPLARPQPDWPAHTSLCGAALYDGGPPDPGQLQRLHEFLERGRPRGVVHADPISAAQGEVPEDAPIVFALGSSAVWVAGDFWKSAIEAAQRLKRRAILLTGQTSLPPLPQDICAFDYLPYSQVFPHAAAVVHQAGIGTLSQALRAGRPQLITPVAFDQPDNAARAAALGLARVLPFQRVTAGRLTQNLRTLLSTRACTARAQALGAELRRNDGAAAAARHIIAALAQER